MLDPENLKKKKRNERKTEVREGGNHRVDIRLFSFTATIVYICIYDVYVYVYI